jgi:hypothetical protein
MTTDQQRILDLIEIDYDLHKTELAGKSGKGPEYEQGFLDGMKHAKNLVRLVCEKEEII